MLDQSRDISVAQSIAPGVKTTTQTGTGVDLQGFEKATVVVYAGVLTDGTYAITVEESDVLGSGYAAVAAEDTVDGDGDGTILPTLAATDDNATVEIGYKGIKRFIRPVVTLAGITSGGVFGALVIRGGARKKPK